MFFLNQFFFDHLSFFFCPCFNRSKLPNFFPENVAFYGWCFLLFSGRIFLLMWDFRIWLLFIFHLFIPTLFVREWEQGLQCLCTIPYAMLSAYYLLRIELAVFKPKVFNLKKATHFFFGNHNLPFSFSLFFSLLPSFPHFQSTYWICALSYFWIFLLILPYWELWKDS